MLIGITGSFGAGKGAVVEYLKEKGFTHYSVSGKLKEMLAERGVLETRQNLSSLADELAEQYDGGILEAIHNSIKEKGEENVALEAIHRMSEAAYLRSVGAVILGVDADVKIRYERISRRQEGEKDKVTYEQFLQDIEREEEGKGSGIPNIRAVLSSADYAIVNNGTLEELHEQVDNILGKIEA